MSVLALTLFSQSAAAFICGTSSAEDQLQRAELIFRGTPYWINPFSGVAYVKVEKVYKGAVPGGLLKLKYGDLGFGSPQPSISLAIGFSKVISASVAEEKQEDLFYADACWDIVVQAFDNGWEDAFARYRERHEALVRKAVLRASDPASWHALAAGEIAAQDWLQLKLTASYLIRLQPNSAEPHLLLARSFVGLWQMDKARQAFRSALALDPKSAKAKKGLDQVHIYESEYGKVDTDRTDFSDVDLRGMDFSNTNLAGRDFSRATGSTKFDGARLRNIKARGADLAGSSFVGADLRGADLSHAQLQEASFRYAQLADADLSGADLGGTVLDGATYSRQTKWPDGFNPKMHKIKLVQ